MQMKGKKQMKKKQTKKERGTDDLAGALMAITAEFGDIFHEWQGPRAAKFFEASGISERNWRIFMRRRGLADGEKWTLRALAGVEGIAHVRVHQIEGQTQKRIWKFFEKNAQRPA